METGISDFNGVQRLVLMGVSCVPLRLEPSTCVASDLMTSQVEEAERRGRANEFPPVGVRLGPPFQQGRIRVQQMEALPRLLGLGTLLCWVNMCRCCLTVCFVCLCLFVCF